MKRYIIYLLRCTGGTLYTGITTDPARRLLQHRCELAGGARYTRSREVISLHPLFAAENRAAASRLEYHLKRLSHAQKLALCQNPQQIFEMLADRLDCSAYDICPLQTLS